MTDTDHDRDVEWFRGAVGPVLDAHPPTDRWEDLRERIEGRPPLVVALVPRRSGRRGRLLALAAAVLVAVAALGTLVVADPWSAPEGDRATPGPAPTSAPAPSTADRPTTSPSTEGPTTEPPPSSTTPPAPLVTVPAVERRVDLSEMGLEVRYLDRAEATVPEGAVVRQIPEPGTQVPEGSLVVVIMSGGGPVMGFEDLPAEAQGLAEGLEGYQRSEPIRRVPTPAGDAFKTDAWLFGPCPAVEQGEPTVLDPSFETRCY